MRLREPVALLLAILSTVSCSENECTCPGPVPLTSGRFVLEARVRYDASGHIYSHGFYFSQGAVIIQPIASGETVDLDVLIHTDETGDPIGLFLASPFLETGFARISTNTSYEEARASFDNLSCISDTLDFEALALPFTKYDVWAVRTRDMHFAKLLAADTFFASQVVDSAGVHLLRHYGEATIDWAYQARSSPCF